MSDLEIKQEILTNAENESEFNTSYLRGVSRNRIIYNQPTIEKLKKVKRNLFKPMSEDSDNSPPKKQKSGETVNEANSETSDSSSLDNADRFLIDAEDELFYETDEEDWPLQSSEDSDTSPVKLQPLEASNEVIIDHRNSASGKQYTILQNVSLDKNEMDEHTLDATDKEVWELDMSEESYTSALEQQQCDTSYEAFLRYRLSFPIDNVDRVINEIVDEIFYATDEKDWHLCITAASLSENSPGKETAAG